MPVAIACGVLLRGEFGRWDRLFVWLAPLTILLAWQAWVATNWGISATASGANNLAWPGSAVGAFLWETAGRAFTSIWTRGLMMLVECVLIAVVAARAMATAAPLWERIGVGLSAVLFVSLSADVWVSDWAFLRAGSELWLLAGTAVLAHPGSVRRLVVVEAVLWVLWVAYRLN